MTRNSQAPSKKGQNAKGQNTKGLRASEGTRQSRNRSDLRGLSGINSTISEPSTSNSIVPPGNSYQSSVPRELGSYTPGTGSYDSSYPPSNTYESVNADGMGSSPPYYSSNSSKYQPEIHDPNRRIPSQTAPTYIALVDYAPQDDPWYPTDSPTNDKYTSRALHHLDNIDLQFPDSSGFIYNRQEGPLRPFERGSPEFHGDEDDYYYDTYPEQNLPLPRSNYVLEKGGRKQLQGEGVADSKPRKMWN